MTGDSLRRTTVAVLCLLLFGSTNSFALVHAHAASASPASLVNPFIGTGGDPDDGIDLFPGAVRPFGMVQLSPDTEDHGFGYHHIHARIKGFSMTHMSGVGCANEGDVFFTATTGPVVTQVADYQTPYSHQRESASPGYYGVDLLQWNIHADLTATERTGIARFNFPAGQVANVLVPISHTLNETASASIHVRGDRRIEGFVEDHVFCSQKSTYKVYFVMEFDRPFSSFGTWSSDQYDGPAQVTEGSRSAAQSTHNGSTGAYASWAAEPGPHAVTARIGISYVDIAGADRNLKAEGSGSFDSIRQEAERAWKNVLMSIEILGGSRERQRVFYTALYHCLLMPRLFDDVDGRYIGFDDNIHTVANGHHAYTNFSGWDIYRSEIPLLTLIEPQRVQDMAQSVVSMYQQGGWMPRWPQINHYTNDMVGSPLSIALSTIWLHGLHGFDMETAWQGMFKDATTPAPAGQKYIGEEGVAWIDSHGYLPADRVSYGSAAKTLEYSLAYASLYRLAVALRKPVEAQQLFHRALCYRNLFDPQDRFLRPRNADGSWPASFNPAQDGHGFIEGTGWHYQTFAPADLSWLVSAVGRDRFNAQLAGFFDYPAPGWYAQFYNPYNETDFQAPYAFHFSGQPWQTLRVVRRVLRENYRDSPDGIPGNDDAGATSSWAVLSMIGMYTVDPASLAYELVSPSFPKIVVHLRSPYPGKAFTITTANDPASAPYIERVTLNGSPHTRSWIPAGAITSGGSLHFALSPTPNRQWGASPADGPPSLSDDPRTEAPKDAPR